MTAAPDRRPALTLLEVLVALAIVAILLGLLLSGIQKVRTAAARTACQNHLRQQALAISHYESRTGRLPPGAVSGPFPALNVPESVSHGLWSVLLNDLGEPALAAAYRWDENYYAAANQPAVSPRIPILLCPALPSDRVEEFEGGRAGGVADFGPLIVNSFLVDLGYLDPGTPAASPMPTNGAVTLDDITDGLSQTILLVESAGRSGGVAWSSSSVPASIRFLFGATPHAGGINVAMADGSVRFFRESVGLRTLAKLATRAGGEVVTVPE